jgi:magnesium chelatase family protein
MAARNRQTERCGGCNAYLSASQLETYGACSQADLRWLQNACEQLQLSARAYHKVLRIARTLADLESTETVQQPHLMEAMQYRCFDRAWR